MTLSCSSLPSRDILYDMATRLIVSHLKEEIRARHRASLFLCGGTTPGPIYERLSETALSWQHVHIGQVDERWVDEADPGSNAALIRRTLLKDNAHIAKFLPMKNEYATAVAGQADVNDIYSSLMTPHSMAVLGMGVDGHIGAWFPKATGLPQALNPQNTNCVQAVKAHQTDVTGVYTERMTLTLPALLECKSILLLITGEMKWEVVGRALMGKTDNLPVSHLFEAVAASDRPDRLIILHSE